MKKETISMIVLFLVAFIWGSAFVATDMAQNYGWETFSIVTVRGLVGGLITLPFAIKNKFWKNKKGLAWGLLLGVLFFIAFYLQTEGQSQTTTVNAAFLTVLYVVFAPLICRIVFKEKQTKQIYLGCVLSVIGVFFLTIMTSENKLSINYGDILVILCAVFFALQIVFAKKSSEHVDAISVTSIMLLVMGVLSFIFMKATNESGIRFDKTILPVLYCAVLSSALASFLQIAAQKHLSSGKASIIMAQEVLIATILDFLLRQAFPTLPIYIGGGLMFVSIIIIEVRFVKKLNIKNYKYILLDVDDTLLDFQKSQDTSIIDAYKKYNINITNEVLDEYKKINVLMWKQYEQNIITTNDIFVKRFEKLNELYKFDCDASEIEKLFRENLNNSYFILDDTIDFLEKTKDKYELVIVTNGKKETQYSRLALSGLDKYFKYIFISEEVGYKKPEVEFFLHLEKTIKDFDKTKAVIIGDSLTSDIQGGINYGIKTCHFNQDNSFVSDKADYTINSLKEIICT